MTTSPAKPYAEHLSGAHQQFATAVQQLTRHADTLKALALAAPTTEETTALYAREVKVREYVRLLERLEKSAPIPEATT